MESFDLVMQIFILACNGFMIERSRCSHKQAKSLRHREWKILLDETHHWKESIPLRWFASTGMMMNRACDEEFVRKSGQNKFHFW